MNIGEMTERSDLSSKMTHNYEKISPIRPTGRSESGYHRYTEQGLESLSFIRHARDVDFSLTQIKTLLQLESNPQCTSAGVKRLIAEHIATLQTEVDRLQDMVNTLRN